MVLRWVAYELIARMVEQIEEDPASQDGIEKLVQAIRLPIGEAGD